MSRKTSLEIKLIKKEVLDLIKGNFTIEEMKQFGKNIYKINEKNIIFDLVYASLNRNQYFFGIEKEQLEELYKETRNYYHIFICGNKKQCFFIPISLLIEILKDSKATQHKGFRQYKPIIMFRNGRWIVRSFGRYDITNYLNQYKLLNENIDKTIIPKANIEIKNETINEKIKNIAKETDLKNIDIHKTIINMLKKIGEWENFDVLTEQKPKGFDDFPYNPDCLWYKNNDLFLAIEVCNKGSIEKDKDSLKQLKTLGARKVVIVSSIDKLERVRKLFMYNGEIKSWTEFWSFERILQLYDDGEKFFNNFNKFKNYSYNENILEYL